METPAPSILIVDDNAMNILLVQQILIERGYDVDSVQSGKEALEHIDGKKPDLVLLDIMMPEMSGYEVCAVLKNKRETRDIPIIFLTAKSQTEDIVKGFKLGAVDYLTKPFNAEELLARIGIHISLIQAQSQLKTQNLVLERRVKERTKKLNDSLTKLKAMQMELVQSEKMAALGEIVAGVTHELATPIGNAKVDASYLKQKTEELDKSYRSEEMTESAFSDYVAYAVESSAAIFRNLENAKRHIDSFKQVSADHASEQIDSFNVHGYIGQILDNHRSRLKRTKHAIVIDCDKNLSIESYPGVFNQIVTNLLLNSLKHAFTEDQAGEIRFDIGLKEDRVVFVYRDNGKGMDAHTVKHVFDPFFTTNRKGGGSGIGMNVVYNLVTKKLQGSIVCRSRPGEGTEFVVTFPELKEGPVPSQPTS